MAHLHFLAFVLFALVFIPLSQSLHSPKDFYKLLSNQSSSPQSHKNNSTRTLTDIDEHYLDACTAILKGFDDVKDDSYSYDHDFAEWENPNPDITFLDYFKNNKGLVSKIFDDDTNYNDNLWDVYLIIYDGIAIDQKAAAVKISLHGTRFMNFDQASATFTTIGSSTFTVYYGEYFETISQTDIEGKVSISFVDTTTNEPMSQFSPQQTSLKDYSFQLSFVSSDGSFSFNTSAFSDTYMTKSDTIISSAFSVASIVILAFSWYTNNMKGKVTYGTLQAFYISATYIGMWTVIQPKYYGLFYWILLIPAVFNVAKCFPYITKQVTLDNFDSALVVMFSGVAGGIVAIFVTSIWANLLPSLVLWFPFIQKLSKMKQDPYYLTRFEICSSLYVLLWTGYLFLYPRNFYRFGQNMTIIYLSFGSIIFQLIVLGIMEIITMKKVKKAALLEDDSMNNQDLKQDSNDQTKQLPFDDEEDPKFTSHTPETTPVEKTHKKKEKYSNYFDFL